MTELLDDPEQESKSRIFHFAWYGLLFLLTFVIFFLFTFPYGVLKEALVSEISQATGYSLRVKEMGPSFLLGADAAGIRISSPDNAVQVEMESVDVTLSVLSLFIGRATVDVELVSKNKGLLDLKTSWTLWQLLKERNFVPSRISLEAKDFELGGLVNLLLYNTSKTANDMIKDLLTQIVFQGNLTGVSDIKLAIDEPIQSTGTIELKIDKATLDLTNPNLVVARQTFKKALVKANLQGGKLNLDSASGLESQEMKIDLKGNSTLRNPFANSILEMIINLKLEGTLKDNFGFILSVMGGNEGELKYQINGTFERPNFQGG